MCPTRDPTRRLARQLRGRPTRAERAFWQHLRRHQFGGFRFRRQQPIGPFIVDFACLERRVLVELDGWPHEHPERRTRDLERDDWLRSQGFAVVRIENGEALSDPEAALARIALALSDGVSWPSPPPRPSPARGEGDA